MSSPGTTLRAPLLWLLLPLMAGLVLAERWPCPLGWLPWLGGLALLCALGAVGLSAHRPSLWASALVPAVLLGGYLGLRIRTPDLAPWAATPREVTVTVAIEQVFPPAPRRKTWSGLGRIVATDRLTTEVSGQRIYFSVIRKLSVLPVRSGHYVVRGVLQALPGDGDPRGFNRYLDALGVRLTLTRGQMLQEVRPPGGFQQFCAQTEDRLETILRRGLERHPELASVYLGMLLGEKAVLSAEQQNAFMRSGTFHIFSISGLHVGVIALAIQSMLALARVPKRAAVVVGLGVLWFYVQVTGASAPAERAFLMIAFMLAAQVFRLPGNALAALAAAALLTLLLDPRQLFSTGCQMSYGVVLALIVMGVPLHERWQAAWRPWRDLPPGNWRWWQRWTVATGRELMPALTATGVATLASTATSIGYFGLFSPGALVANLIVLPLSSLAIIAGFASLLIGLTGWVAGSVFFNLAAGVAIKAMDWLVVQGTELPGVYFRAEFKALWMAPVAHACVLGVMLIGAALRWPRRWGAFWWPVLAVALILFLGVKFAGGS